MCGVLPASGSMTSRLRLGYRDAVAMTGSALFAEGERVAGPGSPHLVAARLGRHPGVALVRLRHRDASGGVCPAPAARLLPAHASRRFARRHRPFRPAVRHLRARPARRTGLMPVTDLVIGLGSRPGASERAVREVVAELLARHGLLAFSVLAYATLDSRAAEPGLRAATAGAGLLGYPALVLAAVEVPPRTGGWPTRSAPRRLPKRRHCTRHDAWPARRVPQSSSPGSWSVRSDGGGGANTTLKRGVCVTTRVSDRIIVRPTRHTPREAGSDSPGGRGWSTGERGPREVVEHGPEGRAAPRRATAGR